LAIDAHAGTHVWMYTQTQIKETVTPKFLHATVTCFKSFVHQFHMFQLSLCDIAKECAHILTYLLTFYHQVDMVGLHHSTATLYWH